MHYLKSITLVLALSSTACCQRVTKHEFTVEHIPCVTDKPPPPPSIAGDQCPEGLEYCLNKDKAWQLATYLESTILWMTEVYELCKEKKDD
jgi:hypothetical protein